MAQGMMMHCGIAAPKKSCSHWLIKFFISVPIMLVACFCGYYYGNYYNSSCFLPFGPSSTTNDKREEMLVAAKNGQCDLSKGEWIPDATGPSYTNETCKFIDFHQNCMRNGRPDRAYLYWRWKPYGCDLPRFNAKKFLNAMRDKSWALIGDSIFRNHVQSLICLLSQEEEPIEIYHDELFESKRWYFPKHNLTLAQIWAPFLVRSNGHSTNKGQLHARLDELEDDWKTQFQNYDYIIISGGQWFYKSTIYWDKNTIIGCHMCPDGFSNPTELGVVYPYRRALRLAFEFMISSQHKPLILFRTWSPQHFENGQWYNGGNCSRTMPYRDGEYNGFPVDDEMRKVEIEEFERAAKEGMKTQVRLELLDIYQLSLLRPDGHPGIYRSLHPENKNKVQSDCLHWCLPGVVDTWNQIAMKMVIGDGENEELASF